jgi:hypothetical protein
MKCLIAVLLLAAPLIAQTHRFAIEGSKFLLDGKPLQIISGEMHQAAETPYWTSCINSGTRLRGNAVPHRSRAGNAKLRLTARVSQREQSWV